MFHATHPVARMASAVLLVQVVLHLTASLYPAHSRVVISEIMYRPGSDEPEWVELYNAADTAVALDGWILHDRTSARPALDGGTIPPHGFVVVTRDTAALRSLRTIPSVVIRLTLPSLNNSGDDVVLLDAAGRTVDSVPFSSSWGGTGRSLERIDHRKSSLEERNWGESLDSTGATPGRKNSIAPAGRDLEVGRGSFDPDRSVLAVIVRNQGIDQSVGATLSLFHDLDRNGRGDVHETISGRSILPIQPDDSIVVELPWPRPLTATGEDALLVLDHPEDEAPENNSALLTLRLPMADSGVIINELMYDPSGDEPEWVEIYNRGDRPVNLDGWVLHDAGKSRPVLPEKIVLPGDYLVVTVDSALLLEERPDLPSPILQAPLPSLNNGGDMVVLRRPDGTMVDSLVYSSSWGGSEGESIERRGAILPSAEQSSWSSSRAPDGATPGGPNSVLLPTRNVMLVGVDFDPQRGTLDVTLRATGLDSLAGAELVAGVDLNGDGMIADEEVAVSREISEDTAAQSISLPWPRPLTEQGETGVIFVRWKLDEYPDDDTLRLILRAPAADSGIIINEFMYDPETGEPEWVELFNLTGDSISLEGWRIGDGSGLSSPIPSISIPGRGWLVITTDTLRLVDRFGPVAPLVQLPSLPGLNNGGDVVKVLNRDRVTLDSLRYSGSWGEDGGATLERKSPTMESTTPTSWVSSSDTLGGTPGRENSWRPVLIDLVLSTPSISTEGEAITISGLVFNRGMPAESSIPDSCRLTLSVDLDRDGTVDSGEELERRGIPFPANGDSTRFALVWSRTPTIDGEWGLLTVDVEGEEKGVDNVRTVVIRRARLDSGLVINEIMYDPVGDEPEWIEIANRSGDTVDLLDWILHDAGSARPPLPAGRLAPGKFIVVTTDSAMLRNTRAVFSAILQTTLPTLNNGGDLIVLRAPNDRVVDSVRYRPDWGGRQGTSLERLGPFRPSGDSASWGNSIDGGGGTPGWENSILPAERDLRLDAAEFDPDRSVVLLAVRNVGSEGIGGAEARLYVDANDNGIPEEGELEIAQSIPSLHPGESLQVECTWQRDLLPEGESGLAEVRLAAEDRTDDNLLPFRPQARLGRSGAIINEFRSSPVGSEPEWVEIFNRGSLPIDLDRWSIADASSSATITSRSILHAGGYALITVDTALLRSAHSLSGTPLLIEVKLPALNNGGDAVVLRNADGVTVDSLAYGTGWHRGEGSLERRHPELDPTDPAVWEVSSDPDGATPGRANATLLPERNLAIDSVRFDVESAWLKIALRNAGAMSTDGSSMHLLLDGIEIDLLPLGPLHFNQSTLLDYSLDVDLSDRPQVLMLILDLDEDTVPGDDTAQVTLVRPPADTGLIITEIMFDPLPTAGGAGAEYVELFNQGRRPVPLDGWSLKEESGKSIMFGEGEGGGPVVLPGRFALVASDSSLFVQFPELIDSTTILIVGEDLGLNNSGDVVLLFNRSGRIADSLPYSSDRHDDVRPDTRGISLERIDFDRPTADPSAWSSSVDRRGGTPAAENSRRLPPVIGEEALELSSPTLSPDGDGFEDFLRIAWHLPFTPASVRITILDRRGKTLATPVDGVQSGPQGDVVWDGGDHDGRSLPLGPVILRLEAIESGTDRRIVLRKIVVIAGRL